MLSQGETPDIADVILADPMRVGWLPRDPLCRRSDFTGVNVENADFTDVGLTSLSGARTLLGALGLTTRSKELLGAK